MENDEQMDKRKVQIIAPAYYARREVQEAIFNFCKHRETVPRYLEGFGKRPDVLDYPSDVMTLVKKGATSFHCSEEIWSDPLKISTDMTPELYNEIRSGWDFLIDIDSKYLDYSKIAAKLIVRFLEHHGVNNVGIKFSGSKGFHILIPWKSFPSEIDGQKTSDMFPEWPRAIAGYVLESVKERLNNEIISLTGKQKLQEKGELILETNCPNCKGRTIEKEVSKYLCPNCKSEVTSMVASRKNLRCSNCQYDMRKIFSKKIQYCEKCKINTEQFSTRGDSSRRKIIGLSTNLPKFNTTETTKSQEDSVDIVLVSPRHLFRAPYSLHEKTALVSCVLTKEELEIFQVGMADPLKVAFRNYEPESKKEEARDLLMQAIDWARKKSPTEKKKYDGAGVDLKGLKISEDIFPDVIKKIISGQKQDGRKRALSVLISFYTSLEMPKDYIEEKVYEWNKKNYKPLKEGYVRSQIEWGIKNKRLPPNYDKPIYREIVPEGFETGGLKNPINYTIREAMRRSPKEGNKNKKVGSVQKKNL